MNNLNGCLLFSILIILFSCKSKDLKSDTDIGQPNIVFIFADDLTYTAIHELGNNEIKTPNLDKMVQNGTTFTHAFNMGSWSGAVCVASRAMIISGRSVWRANEFRQNWVKGDSTSYEKTWGKIMEMNGYDTYMTGKWHVDAPADKVFQNTIHIRPGMPSDFWNNAEIMKRFSQIDIKNYAETALIMPKGYNRPLSIDDQNWISTDTSAGGYWKDGKHWSEVLKDDAIAFVEKAKNKNNPFFMYLAFNAPHDPRQAPETYLEMYKTNDIKIPASFLTEYPFKDGIGNSPSLRDEALAPFPRTEFAIKKHIQEYYALISHLDTQIGEIIDALENSGKMDNTIIFFSADHGLAMGRHGLLGKQNMFDHSIRAPLLAMGPGIPKGNRIDADVYIQDVMATSLDFAEIKAPEYIEFHSFRDLIQNTRKESHYKRIYGAYLELQRMIRKDGYKLIVYPKINKILLFDLVNDPEEMHDLSEMVEHQDLVSALFQELLLLQKEMGDQLDLSKFNFTK